MSLDIPPTTFVFFVEVWEGLLLVGFVQYRKVFLGFWEIFIVELLDIGSLGELLCSYSYSLQFSFLFYSAP